MRFVVAYRRATVAALLAAAGCYAGPQPGEEALVAGSSDGDDTDGGSSSDATSAPGSSDGTDESTGGPLEPGDESTTTTADEDSESSGTPPAAACIDYSQAEHFGAAVSFAADVVPIFQAHCNNSSCHASDSPSPAAGLRLGAGPDMAMTTEQIANVRAAIVGVSALKAQMQLVEPGSPAASFLLVKTEYTDPTDCEAVECKPAGCGVRMPMQAVGGLSADEVKTLRTWIRDGAGAD